MFTNIYHYLPPSFSTVGFGTAEGRHGSNILCASVAQLESAWITVDEMSETYMYEKLLNSIL